MLNKWKNDFARIYQNSNTQDMTFDDDFLDDIKKQLHEGHIQSEKDATSLNEAIAIEEVKLAVHKAKIWKAKGIDEIPPRVLKNPLCINMLHKLMSLAFEQGMVPLDWNRGMIQPIP